MDAIPFHVDEIFEDVDDSHWFSQRLISDVIEDHAPLKRKKLPKKPIPCMNSKLRKACHKKALDRNKYFRNGRTKKSWEIYRKSRNYATKLKAQSIQTYFKTYCNGQRKNKTFWDAVKPFTSDSMAPRNDCLILKDGEEIISDPYTVGNIFNDYFVNQTILSKSGKHTDEEEINHVTKRPCNSHDSIKIIKENCNPPYEFSFNEVTPNVVFRHLKDFDAKKGYWLG